MTGISLKEKQLEWACRVLITVDLFVIISGYLSYFQVKYQLVSPLIPKSTVYQILADNNDIHMKGSLIASAVFLIGIWLYTFNKKKLALILFALTVISFYLLDYVNLYTPSR